MQDAEREVPDQRGLQRGLGVPSCPLVCRALPNRSETRALAASHIDTLWLVSLFRTSHGKVLSEILAEREPVSQARRFPDRCSATMWLWGGNRKAIWNIT